MRSRRTGGSDGKDLEEAGAEVSRDGGGAAQAQACGVWDSGGALSWLSLKGPHWRRQRTHRDSE